MEDNPTIMVKLSLEIVKIPPLILCFPSNGFTSDDMESAKQKKRPKRQTSLNGLKRRTRLFND